MTQALRRALGRTVRRRQSIGLSEVGGFESVGWRGQGENVRGTRQYDNATCMCLGLCGGMETEHKILAPVHTTGEGQYGTLDTIGQSSIQGGRRGKRPATRPLVRQKGKDIPKDECMRSGWTEFDHLAPFYKHVMKKNKTRDVRPRVRLCPHSSYQYRGMSKRLSRRIHPPPLPTVYPFP
jgi:hypothetical protein